MMTFSFFFHINIRFFYNPVKSNLKNSLTKDFDSKFVRAAIFLGYYQFLLIANIFNQINLFICQLNLRIINIFILTLASSTYSC